MKKLEDIRAEFGIHFKDAEDELIWLLHDIERMNRGHLGIGMILGSVIVAVIIVLSKIV
jgi:hypothetical protein